MTLLCGLRDTLKRMVKYSTFLHALYLQLVFTVLLKHHNHTKIPNKISIMGV